MTDKLAKGQMIELPATVIYELVAQQAVVQTMKESALKKMGELSGKRAKDRTQHFLLHYRCRSKSSSFNCSACSAISLLSFRLAYIGDMDSLDSLIWYSN